MATGGEFLGATGLVELNLYGTGMDVHVTKWDLNMSRDMIDITQLADSSPFHKEFIGGFTEWSGSFEGFLDATTPIDEAAFNGVAVSATFTDGDAIAYAGKILMSSIAIVNDTQDVVRITANFQGTGNMTVG